MAALNTVVDYFADEIRQGIALVVIWKTGRGWNGYATWPDPDANTFDPDDLKKAHEILETDPNAIMLKGYSCGRFYYEMTKLEIARRIRWHYENGHNLLRNSTTMNKNKGEK